jgi:hypothetical protein
MRLVVSHSNPKSEAEIWSVLKLRSRIRYEAEVSISDNFDENSVAYAEFQLKRHEAFLCTLNLGLFSGLLSLANDLAICQIYTPKCF